MIQLLFEFESQKIGVEINGENIIFYDFLSLTKAPIDGLQLSYEGTIKEFPDLKDNPEWRSMAIQRFKEKVKSLEQEEKRSQYIISEFKRMGYKPLMKQRGGFRPEKIKDDAI